MSMNAIEIVTVHTANRGAFSVAVYETKDLGWAANYGALETYNNPTRAAAVASLKLLLEVVNPAPGANCAEAFSGTLRCAERGLEY